MDNYFKLGIGVLSVNLIVGIGVGVYTKLEESRSRRLEEGKKK